MIKRIFLDTVENHSILQGDLALRVSTALTHNTVTIEFRFVQVIKNTDIYYQGVCNEGLEHEMFM